jgi:hypothetical protein
MSLIVSFVFYPWVIPGLVFVWCWGAHILYLLGRIDNRTRGLLDSRIGNVRPRACISDSLGSYPHGFPKTHSSSLYRVVPFEFVQQSQE